jgi:hypothetical protein
MQCADFVGAFLFLFLEEIVFRGVGIPPMSFVGAGRHRRITVSCRGEHPIAKLRRSRTPDDHSASPRRAASLRLSPPSIASLKVHAIANFAAQWFAAGSVRSGALIVSSCLEARANS